MARRYYSSTAVETTLTSSVSNSATTLPVASTSGFPGTTPFTLILDEGTVNEEIVTVTGVASLNLTVTRGEDGTSAVSHSNGGTVKHGVSARDFDEANAHVNTTSGNPHSVTAADVGAVANSLVDAKGDLIAASADNTPARLAVGTNNYVLTAASGESTGLKYSNILTNLINLSPEERANVVASAATGTINIDVLTASVWFYTSDASANHTINFRGDSGTTLSSLLAVGDSISVMWLVTNGSTPYYPNVVQIDGSSVTPKWAGGTAPTAGNASSIDAYSFSIIKTAATPTYTVFGGQTKFA